MSVSYKEEMGVGIITFDNPDAKVNVLNSDTLLRLNKILDDVTSKSLKALILQSTKKDVFIAGADIKEIENIVDPKIGVQKSEAGQRIFDRIEDLPYPTIALIDGVALGGGCEIALSCRYRVATFNDKVKIGLPEVNLGILPGFGGTYRLPRLIGLTESLKMILSCSQLSSQQALRVGLVDRLYPQTNLSERMAEFVEEVASVKDRRIKFPLKAKKGFEAFLEKNPLGNVILFNETRKNVLKTTKGFYPAPIKAMEVVQRTRGMDRKPALRIEAEEFAQLAVTSVSKNLVKCFFLSEKYKKLTIPGTENQKPKKVAKAGVIGAGIMGGGIAQLLSNRGIAVRLKDINYDAIGKGFQAAYKIYEQAMKRRKAKASDVAVKMALITGATDYSGFNNLDVTIEAVVENMDIKKKVFKELSDISSPDTLLCSNTSSLSVTEMSKAVKDPSKVIGFHFFNPVHRMPLVEIITTDVVSQESTVRALDFVKQLGKTPIIVKDAPGFLVNRLLLAYINESGRILQEGGDIVTIDKVMTDFGMPMGPFTLSDEVGLDVGVKVLHVLEAGLGKRFEACRVFNKILDKKLLGKKSGKGFYVHSKKRVPNKEINEILAGSGGKSNFDKQEALERMLFIMINEAAMCIQEKVVDSAETVDIGMIMGTGFPPFRGGLLRYADALGIKNVVATLRRLDDKFKDGRFKPCQLLVEMEQKSQPFFS